MNWNKKKEMIRWICLFAIIEVGYLLMILVKDVNYKELNIFSIFLNLNNPGRNMEPFLLISVLLPFLCLNDWHSYANNKFDYFLITRIGYQNYFKIRIKNVFFKTLFFVYALHLINFIALKVVFNPPFNEGEGILLVNGLFYQGNEFLNVITFVLLSGIGCSIMSVFWLYLIEVIKNKYVYQVSIPLISFSAIMLYFLLFSVLNKGINSYIFNTILTCFIPINLIFPGMVLEANGFLAFISSALFYLVMIVLCNNLTIKMRQKNG